MNPVFSVIIPAYNEALTIEVAVRETIHAFEKIGKSYELLCINDGSKDNTLAILNQLQQRYPHLIVIDQQPNQGKGEAIKRGVLEATGDYLLFLDADLAVHPKTIESFLPFIEQADIIIGSRQVEGAKITNPQPWHRQLLGRGFNQLVQWMTGLTIKDTQCGFKIFTQASAKQLFTSLQTKGWVFDVEVLVKAKQSGYTIKELPVSWHNGRESKLKLIDAFHIFLELIRLRRH